MFNPIFLGASFLLWIYSFLNFYPGKIVLYADAERNFIYTNYFLNNILRGVFPMWTPFSVWGRPDDFGVRVIGEFNPFLYSIIFFQKIGLSVSLAYYLYLILYFFLGMIGFYLLARRLFSDKAMACTAMLLVMFSTLGSNLFNDILVILTIVPTIWVFYFLARFTQAPDKLSFLGLTYSLMIIAITYLPFYFLTTFFVFVVFFAVLYSRETGTIIFQYGRFILKNKIFAAVCAFGLALSAAPGLLWMIAGSSGEYIASWRPSAQEGTNTAAMEIGTINLSSLVGANSLTGLFSDLNHLHAGSIYIPIFVLVVLLLGSIVNVNKRMVLYLGVSLLLFFISLADVSPVHGFLYNHVPYFKFFRNMHYLYWFAYPFFVLFVVEQFQGLLSCKPAVSRTKFLFAAYITILCLGFMIFLLQQDNIVTSSLINVVLVLGFFLVGIFLRVQAAGWMSLFLLIIILVQPLEVLKHLGDHARTQPSRYAAGPYVFEESRPQFSYLRPQENEALKDTQGFGDVKDTSGFVEGNYFGIKSSFDLHNNISRDILEGYVRYKLIVYDNISRMNPQEIDYGKIQDAFVNNLNVAFVHNDERTQLPEHMINESSAAPLKLIADCEELKVLNFDINSINMKTNFASDKFLVYSDSFHSHWQARVNGRPATIYKANGAFKGLWLKAGENVVDLRFRSVERYLFNFGLLIVFAVFLSSLMVLAVKESKQRKVSL